MLASDFITKREKLCRAYQRGIVDKATFQQEMHNLFVAAQVSREDDYDKAIKVYEAFIRQS